MNPWYQCLVYGHRKQFYEDDGSFGVECANGCGLKFKMHPDLQWLAWLGTSAGSDANPKKRNESYEIDFG